ncbi:MAG: leucine-rich repeat domain-containing protein, partial [Clostridia bacterium]|nr:leucine-rich repeat domain-containing protein [Clostridia bacterium]
MKTKKILAAIAAITLVFGAVPTQLRTDVIGNMVMTASAEEADVIKGNCGVRDEETGEFADNATYVFDKATGTLTISGTGEIGEVQFRTMEREWNEKIINIVIEDGITSIGQTVFGSLLSLTSVKMNGVLSIGSGAFARCISLKSVEMDSVTSIGSAPFFGCSSLGPTVLGPIVPDGIANLYNYNLVIPVEAYGSYKYLEDDGYTFKFRDIKGVGYTLDGQIGIKLATDLSAEKLVVKCGEKEIALTQKDGYVEFYVAAQDMAKDYAVYYNAYPKKLELAKFSPKNSLAGYEETEYKAVANALMDYCEAANKYFNRGEVADMSAEYDAVINAITPSNADMGEDY